MRLPVRILAIFFFCIGNAAYCQQAPQFTQYFFDQLSFNPAVAGSETGFSGSLLYRAQWTGFNGGPMTGAVNLHQPLDKFNSGVGLSILSDQIGNFRTVSAAPCYAYKMQLGLKSLQFGLSPVFTSYAVSDNWQSVDDKTTDPSIPQGGKNGLGVNFNTGIYLRGGKYYGGISVVNLVANRIKATNQQLSPTMFAQAGYQFKSLFAESVDWTVSTMYRSPFKNTTTAQIDISLTALLKETFGIGVNYRNGDSFSPILSYQKYTSSGKIRIGYAFDYTTSTFTKANSGSHEIVFSYLYIPTKTVENERYKNVRFL